VRATQAYPADRGPRPACQAYQARLFGRPVGSAVREGTGFTDMVKGHVEWHVVMRSVGWTASLGFKERYEGVMEREFRYLCKVLSLICCMKT
jgi:hypothetical protein